MLDYNMSEGSTIMGCYNCLFSWLFTKLCVAEVNPWLLSGLCGHHTNEAATLSPTVRGLLSSLCPLIATSQALVLLNRGLLNDPALH